MWQPREVDQLVDYLADRDPDAAARAGDELRAASVRLARLSAAAKDDLRTTSIAQVEAVFSKELCAAVDNALRHHAGIVRERVDTPDGSWTIELIDNEYLPLEETKAHDPFSVLAIAPGFISAIAELCAYSERVITTRRWVNRYEIGDAIAPHDDTTGDFQIMICLTAPPPLSGGTLVLENGASADLAIGDLLVMRHAGVVHWTTPIGEGAPIGRATATCRYYVEGGRLPRSRILPHTGRGPRTFSRGRNA